MQFFRQGFGRRLLIFALGASILIGAVVPMLLFAYDTYEDQWSVEFPDYNIVQAVYHDYGLGAFTSWCFYPYEPWEIQESCSALFDNPLTISTTTARWYKFAIVDGITYPATSDRYYSFAFYWDGTTFDNVYNDYDFSSLTRIIELLPEEATTTPSGVPVLLSLHAYIASQSTFWDTIKVDLILEDQSRVGIPFFVDTTTQLFYGKATTTGHWWYSTTTALADGNYRIEATLQNSTLGGLIDNPFGANVHEWHQFVVGTSTFLGSIRQNLTNDLDIYFTSKTATTTQAMAGTCNPLGGTFDIRDCMAFLFIPDSGTLKERLEEIKTGILTKAPWGYLYRLYNILADTDQVELPSFTVHVRTGETATSTLTFNPGDMIAGGGTLLESVKDPIYGKSARDVFEPFVKLAIALAVVFTIIHDLIGLSHGSERGRERGAQKTV